MNSIIITFITGLWQMFKEEYYYVWIHCMISIMATIFNHLSLLLWKKLCKYVHISLLSYAKIIGILYLYFKTNLKRKYCYILSCRKSRTNNQFCFNFPYQWWCIKIGTNEYYSWAYTKLLFIVRKDCKV